MVCEQPVYLGSKRKQNIVVNDRSASCSVQLWEENIGLLEEGKSYCLDALWIGEYNSTKYLAFSREGSKVTPAEKAIEAVEPIMCDGRVFDVDNSKITAVYKLESFKSCFWCRSKMEPGSPPLERCIDCNVLQNYQLCQLGVDESGNILPAIRFRDERSPQDCLQIPHS